VEWKQNAYSFLEDDDEPKGSIPVNEKKEDEPVEKEEDEPVEREEDKPEKGYRFRREKVYRFNVDFSKSHRVL